MRKNSPFIIVEDDMDDCEFIQSALNELGLKNEQLFFQNGQQALKYLQSDTQSPAIILCDINMPIMNGFELKMRINQEDKLRKQSIPFIFLSTSASVKDINTAFEMMVQGYFKKPSSFKELIELLQMIVNYWTKCEHP